MSRPPPTPLGNFCPECGGRLLYDVATKRYSCQSCGLYATKDQLRDIRDRVRSEETEESRRKRKQSEYLEWWLSDKDSR